MEGQRCEIPTGFSREGGRIPITAKGMCGRGAGGGAGRRYESAVWCNLIHNVKKKLAEEQRKKKQWVCHNVACQQPHDPDDPVSCQPGGNPTLTHTHSKQINAVNEGRGGSFTCCGAHNFLCTGTCGQERRWRCPPLSWSTATLCPGWTSGCLPTLSGEKE